MAPNGDSLSGGTQYLKSQVPVCSMMSPSSGYNTPGLSRRNTEEVYAKYGQTTDEVYSKQAEEQKPPLLTLSPLQVYRVCVQIAVKKARVHFFTTFVLAIYAGFYLSLGGMLLSTVGGGSPLIATNNPGLSKFIIGSIGLPFGLYLVVMTGSELFTSNCMFMAAGWYEGAVTTLDVLQSLIVCYIGNFLGSVTMAYVGRTIGFLPAPSMKAFAIALAVTKTSYNFGRMFLKGVMCNWMVCAGIWLATGATSGSSKFIAIFVPVLIFVALGFEHSIANQYLIPQGILVGAPVSVGRFIVRNQIPVVLGNIFGGAVMVSALAYVVFSPTKSVWVQLAKEKIEGLIGKVRKSDQTQAQALPQ